MELQAVFKGCENSPCRTQRSSLMCRSALVDPMRSVLPAVPVSPAQRLEGGRGARSLELWASSEGHVCRSFGTSIRPRAAEAFKGTTRRYLNEVILSSKVRAPVEEQVRGRAAWFSSFPRANSPHDLIPSGASRWTYPRGS